MSKICTVRTKRIGLDWIGFWSTKPAGLDQDHRLTDLDWIGFFQINPFHTLLLTHFFQTSPFWKNSYNIQIFRIKTEYTLTLLVAGSWLPLLVARGVV